MAAARNGKDNMNKSTDAKEWSNRDGKGSAPGNGASEGGEAASGKKHGNRTGMSGEEAHPDGNFRGAEVQDRQENPGKKRPRIGTSGAAKGGGSGSKTRRGEHEQEQ